MSIFYFDALPKDGQPSDPERNYRRAEAIMRCTNDMLDPFGLYLSTAIKAMKNKAHIKAHWKPLRESGFVRLKPLENLFRIEKTCTIRLANNGQRGVYRMLLRGGSQRANQIQSWQPEG